MRRGRLAGCVDMEGDAGPTVDRGGATLPPRSPIKTILWLRGTPPLVLPCQRILKFIRLRLFFSFFKSVHFFVSRREWDQQRESSNGRPSERKWNEMSERAKYPKKSQIKNKRREGDVNRRHGGHCPLCPYESILERMCLWTSKITQQVPKSIQWPYPCFMSRFDWRTHQHNSNSSPFNRVPLSMREPSHFATSFGWLKKRQGTLIIGPNRSLLNTKKKEY